MVCVLVWEVEVLVILVFVMVSVCWRWLVFWVVVWCDWVVFIVVWRLLFWLVIC